MNAFPPSIRVWVVAAFAGLTVVTVVAASFSARSPGPVFYNGEDISIQSYSFKQKLKRSELSTADLAWLLTPSEENPNPPSDVRLTQEEKSEMGLESLPEDPTRADLTKAELRREYLIIKANSAFNGKSRSGRYIYTGKVPRFSAENLELYVSKIGLTLRVKAWADQSFIDNYQYQLLDRWMKIYRDFQDPILWFEPMRDPKAVLKKLKKGSLKNWFTVAAQYMSHSMEDTGIDLYAGGKKSRVEYKKEILKGMLRTMMSDPKLEIEDGFALYEKLATPEARAAAAADSRALFTRNLGENFSADTSHIVNGTPSVGALTFVYPIAANSKGPYSEPPAQVIPFGGHGKTYADARWMSDYWGDEYGGFPFMEVIDGVGFHGPITSKNALNLWFLQRAYVSHGCFRIDAGDVMEIRAMLPAVIFGKDKPSIPLRITEWPDVARLSPGSEPEVMDVAYYTIPNSLSGGVSKYLTPDAQLAMYPAPSPMPSPSIVTAPVYGPEPLPSAVPSPAPSVSPKPKPNAQTTFWSKHFGEWTKWRFFRDPVTSKKYRVTVDPLSATVKNLPIYGEIGEPLKIIGILPEAKIHVFPSRKTSIVQYHEDGVLNDDTSYSGKDGRGGNHGVNFSGKYHPGRELRY